jgi:hypothetical protein
MVGAVASKRSMAAFALLFSALSAMTPAAADQTSVETRQRADEQEMLARARQEAEERRTAPRRLEGTVNIGQPNPDDTAARQRETELHRLSEKLRRASEVRAARVTPPVNSPAVGGDWKVDVTVAPRIEREQPAFHSESRSALGHRASVGGEGVARDSHATVLMTLAPGNRGIRRFEKTADPILCANDGCYISNGSGTAARYISLRRSFGILNTFGPRAGACRNQLACVFRGVDVSAANTILQPVDLRVINHDRRDIKAALVDDTCKVDAGQLSCSKPIIGDGFVLWVVPERVATRAGSEALQRAVDGGLVEGTRRAQLLR